MPHKTISLGEEHIEFLAEHPEINFSALVRQTIERRMVVQELLEEVSYDGILREVEGEIWFQATTEELEPEVNGDIPVEIEISPIGGQTND